jgi:hypothetical protein
MACSCQICIACMKYSPRGACSASDAIAVGSSAVTGSCYYCIEWLRCCAVCRSQLTCVRSSPQTARTAARWCPCWQHQQAARCHPGSLRCSACSPAPCGRLLLRCCRPAQHLASAAGPASPVKEAARTCSSSGKTKSVGAFPVVLQRCRAVSCHPC